MPLTLTARPTSITVAPTGTAAVSNPDNLIGPPDGNRATASISSGQNTDVLQLRGILNTALTGYLFEGFKVTAENLAASNVSSSAQLYVGAVNSGGSVAGELSLAVMSTAVDGQTRTSADMHKSAGGMLIPNTGATPTNLKTFEQFTAPSVRFINSTGTDDVGIDSVQYTLIYTPTITGEQVITLAAPTGAANVARADLPTGVTVAQAWTNPSNAASLNASDASCVNDGTDGETDWVTDYLEFTFAGSQVTAALGNYPRELRLVLRGRVAGDPTNTNGVDENTAQGHGWIIDRVWIKDVNDNYIVEPKDGQPELKYGLATWLWGVNPAGASTARRDRAIAIDITGKDPGQFNDTFKVGVSFRMKNPGNVDPVGSPLAMTAFVDGVAASFGYDTSPPVVPDGTLGANVGQIDRAYDAAFAAAAAWWMEWANEATYADDARAEDGPRRM